MGFLYVIERFVIVKHFIKKHVLIHHPRGVKNCTINQGLTWHWNPHLLSLNAGLFPFHPDVPKEGLGMPSLPSDAGAPQHELAKHLLTLLVLIHPVIIKQKTPNLQVSVVRGGGLLDHRGENLHQKLKSEKRLGDLEIDNHSRFPTVRAPTWVMEQVLGPWSPPRASCPLLQLEAQGKRRWATWPQLGGAASSWGALSSRKPCRLQITEALCYAQRHFYFYCSGINFPKQTFANAEMKTEGNELFSHLEQPSATSLSIFLKYHHQPCWL